jgi:putative ABC transport system substrate-binding protein
MKRREFIALVGGAAAWPLAARAQQAGKVWRIGILTGASPSDFSELGAAFVQGMRELGYVEGHALLLLALIQQNSGPLCRELAT